VQRRILAHVGHADELHGMTASHRCGHFNEVDAVGAWNNSQLAVARRVERVVAADRLAGAVDVDRGAAAQADEARFLIASGEGDCRVVGVEADAPVVKESSRRLAGSHRLRSALVGGRVPNHATGCR